RAGSRNRTPSPSERFVTRGSTCVVRVRGSTNHEPERRTANHEPRTITSRVIASVDPSRENGIELTMLIHAIAVAVILQMNNVAQAPTGPLERAQQEVIRLYHNIGVDVAWAGADPSSATPAPAIRVVLVPYEAGDMSRREKLVMGAAVLTKLGTSVAYIFYRQVEAQARQYDYSLPMILASAIAHEVGHLLLPDGRHSPEGLMRACWTRDDF